jgi:hypothetical protein
LLRRIIVKNLFHAASLILVCGASAQVTRQGHVVLHVVDSFGRPIAYSVRSFVAGGRDFSSAFVGLKSMSPVPFGYYRYKLVPTETGTEYDTVGGEVVVEAEVAWELIHVERGRIEDNRWEALLPPRPAPTLVEGRVEARVSAACANWVRVASLFRGTFIDAPISPEGKFSVRLNSGYFVAWAFLCGKLWGHSLIDSYEDNSLRAPIVISGGTYRR